MTAKLENMCCGKMCMREKTVVSQLILQFQIALHKIIYASPLHMLTEPYHNNKVNV